jgi:hypothetical protein
MHLRLPFLMRRCRHSPAKARITKAACPIRRFPVASYPAAPRQAAVVGRGPWRDSAGPYFEQRFELVMTRRT